MVNDGWEVHKQRKLSFLNTCKYNVESKVCTLQTLFLLYRIGNVTDYLDFRNSWKENIYFHPDNLEQLQSTVNAEETLLPGFQFCTVLVSGLNGATNAYHILK